MDSPPPGLTPPMSGPPYPPQNAGLGLTPTPTPDIPLASVFLFLFLASAAANMTIFQLNRARKHKFPISGMLFGFCIARTVTCILRIIWATQETNIPLAIAAQVFVSAGILILFIINLLFTQRLLRASHPHLARRPAFSSAFRAYYISLALVLVLLITVAVQTFETLNPDTLHIDRALQQFGATYFAVSALLPVLLLALFTLLPRPPHPDKFGTGRFRSKIALLITSSLLLSLGAWFRAGITFAPRPRAEPAWYHSKACFYVFNLGIEIVVVVLYLVARVDVRFHVPDRSCGPGAYSGKRPRGRSEEEASDGGLPREGEMGGPLAERKL
ncbi:MAG: hypothetical protein M1829_005072 [Trizodia sp. TS-e1964]|nr:MAG: hypothetical protein M1829_005072 [Trizodia sp. TS-e1964]